MSPSDNVVLASRKCPDNWFHNTRVISWLFDNHVFCLYSGPSMSRLTVNVTCLLSRDLRVVSRQWGITVFRKDNFKKMFHIGISFWCLTKSRLILYKYHHRPGLVNRRSRGHIRMGLLFTLTESNCCKFLSKIHFFCLFNLHTCTFYASSYLNYHNHVIIG